MNNWNETMNKSGESRVCGFERLYVWMYESHFEETLQTVSTSIDGFLLLSYHRHLHRAHTWLFQKNCSVVAIVLPHLNALQITFYSSWIISIRVHVFVSLQHSIHRVNFFIRFWGCVLEIRFNVVNFHHGKVVKMGEYNARTLLNENTHIHSLVGSGSLWYVRHSRYTDT